VYCSGPITAIDYPTIRTLSKVRNVSPGGLERRFSTPEDFDVRWPTINLRRAGRAVLFIRMFDFYRLSDVNTLHGRHRAGTDYALVNCSITCQWVIADWSTPDSEGAKCKCNTTCQSATSQLLPVRSRPHKAGLDVCPSVRPSVRTSVRPQKVSPIRMKRGV